MSGLEEIMMSELDCSTLKVEPNRLFDTAGAGAQRGAAARLNGSEGKGRAMTWRLGDQLNWMRVNSVVQRQTVAEETTKSLR